MTDAVRRVLRTSLGLAVAHSQNGSIVLHDWSKMKETLLATTTFYSELKNICVWNKTNAGWDR